MAITTHLSPNDVDINHILLAKPSKSEGTYVSSITYCSKDEPLNIVFENALLINCKQVVKNEEYMMTLKHSKSNNFFYDLNQYIIDVVKEKSKKWFNNNMNTELVEEYYASTLAYDKTHKDVLKLKVVGDNYKELQEKYVGKKVNIEMSFLHLRFYKQKFIIEFDINDISLCDDTNLFDSDGEYDGEFEDDEEVPTPFKEDIEDIKKSTIVICSKKLQELKNEKDELEHKLSEANTSIETISRLLDEMENQKEYNKIVRFCNDLQSLCE